MLAVDFERVERLVPARVARRLERRERSVLEPAQERARVVDPDGLDLAGQVVLALLDERLGHRRDLGDRAVQPERGVDAVREQIAGDAAAGDLHVEAPQALAALRQVLGDRPVLQELRAVVEDAPELSLVDQVLQQHDRRHAPVVVPDRVRHARRLDRRDHRLGLGGVAAERLLAHHHLAGLGRRDRDVVMGVVGLAMSMRSMSFRSTSLRQSVSIDS